MRILWNSTLFFYHRGQSAVKSLLRMETYLFWIMDTAARLEQAPEWYFYKRMMKESERSTTGIESLLRIDGARDVCSPSNIRHKSFQRLNYPANIAIFVHVIIHNK